MEKAFRAVTSAKLLLDANDFDGAANRAYYAMFDAARAALMWAGAPSGAQSAKTHSGLISAFSQHLVKPGRLPASLGRSLNRVAEIRLVADYTGDGVTIDKAQWALEHAALFVQNVRQELAPAEPDTDET
jgi:uncharacterized protein (UPF0332 family)